MNNDNKVETAIAGLNCWASYAAAKQGILLKEQEKGSIPRWVHSKVIGSHSN